MAKTNEEWNAIARRYGFKNMDDVANWQRTEGRKWGYTGTIDGKFGESEKEGSTLSAYRKWNSAKNYTTPHQRKNSKSKTPSTSMYRSGLERSRGISGSTQLQVQSKKSIQDAYKSNDIEALTEYANELGVSGKSAYDLYRNIIGAINAKTSTKTAYEPSKKNTNKSGKTSFVCDTEECAEYANQELRNFGYDVSNSAWNRSANSGALDFLFSGFNGINRPDEYDENTVKLNNLNAVKNMKEIFDITQLDPNEIYSAGMTYYSSPKTDKSYDQGTNNATNTHTGNIYFDDDTNSWRVNHNIHGNVYDDDLLDLVYNGNSKYGLSTVAKIPSKNIVSKAINKMRSWGQ